MTGPDDAFLAPDDALFDEPVEFRLHRRERPSGPGAAAEEVVHQVVHAPQTGPRKLIAQATDSLTQVIEWLAVGSHAGSLRAAEADNPS